MDCHQADAAEQATRHSACNDRRVLNGTFWVLRSVTPWRDLPTYGPVPRYNRFVRLASGTRSWMRWLLALAHAGSATSINRFTSRTIGAETASWCWQNAAHPTCIPPG